MAGALDGQVAVVTGASRGIGRACAIELAKLGATVVVNYTSNEDAANSCKAAIEAAGGKAIVLKADVGNSEEARAMIKAAEDQLGKVDILINNAGINRDRMIQRMSDDEWNQVIQTDLSSIFYTTQAVLGGMRERGSGTLAGIASVAGYRGLPGGAAYSASKAAAITYLESLRVELRASGVKVVTVCPGYVATPMTENNPYPMPFRMSAETAARKPTESRAECTVRVIRRQGKSLCSPAASASRRKRGR